MSSPRITNTTDATFESDVIRSSTPVVVDFWAEWCGPCKMMAPLLDRVADELGEKVKIVKLDVDSNQMASGQFGIRGIPTLMVFKDGQPVATKVGAIAYPQLKSFVESHL